MINSALHVEKTRDRSVHCYCRPLTNTLRKTHVQEPAGSCNPSLVYIPEEAVLFSGQEQQCHSFDAKLGSGLPGIGHARCTTHLLSHHHLQRSGRLQGPLLIFGPILHHLLEPEPPIPTSQGSSPLRQEGFLFTLKPHRPYYVSLLPQPSA